jgi:hypothetical protein
MLSVCADVLLFALFLLLLSSLPLYALQETRLLLSSADAPELLM